MKTKLILDNALLMVVFVHSVAGVTNVVSAGTRLLARTM